MPAETIAAAQVTEDLHAWEAGGAKSAEALTAWVSARLAAHEAALAALLAVEGPRTPENTLRLYDVAIEQLSLAGAQAGVLNSVAADTGGARPGATGSAADWRGGKRVGFESCCVRGAGCDESWKAPTPRRSTTWNARC